MQDELKLVMAGEYPDAHVRNKVWRRWEIHDNAGRIRSTYKQELILPPIELDICYKETYVKTLSGHIIAKLSHNGNVAPYSIVQSSNGNAWHVLDDMGRLVYVKWDVMP